MQDYLGNRAALGKGAAPKAGNLGPRAGTLATLKEERRLVVEKEGVRPRVETIHEGERINRIVVTCADGQIIEIDCLYR